MTRFDTLENISVDELLRVFNLAFSDYLTPLQLTLPQLEAKLIAEQIDLRLSPGAFQGGELVGFVLHGIREASGRRLAYNGGTGVVPSARGQQLTRRMYDHILPLLRAAEVDSILLEVITANKTAHSIYEQLGFRCKRELLCCRGEVRLNGADERYPFQLDTLPDCDWPLLRSFWDVPPSWQNDVTAVEALGGQLLALGAFEEGALRGYAVFNPASKRFLQLAVDPGHRQRGVATALLGHVAARYGVELSVYNIDAGAATATRFLEKAGLLPFVTQYEMERPLR